MTQEGYLFHRGKSWFVRYYDSAIVDGVAKRVQVCKRLNVEFGGDYRTKKSVKRFAEELLEPLNKNEVRPSSNTRVVDFVDLTYLPSTVSQLRPATRYQYANTWRLHLKPRMGKTTLREFETFHGQQMLDDIAASAQLGKRSLIHCKNFLRCLFSEAKRLGALKSENPILAVQIPRNLPAPPETHAYSMDEVKTMLSKLNEPARSIVLLAAVTGLRRSEISGLRWRDYDGSMLRVNRSVWHGTVSEPKTAKSKAAVPVLPALSQALEKHRLRAGILAQPDSPIFSSRRGNPLNLDNLTWRFISPKCDWHGWHGFRRGLATNLHSLKVDDKTIQAILRHSDIRTTQNVYVKTVDGAAEEAMTAFGARFESEMCNGYATDSAPRPN